ncbi:Uma2 family endonuclease [Streptomyces oceani]|uniref:Putative restriction endonuclease domain-containing protein n=1 Tax=Streptomyces oceani TaxID=1075402 RepID=A0A1E7KG65_9ACTN|nr:Uma2 family endonuclease [Streptomyces oceani]OEV02908.1 hypothetical protein AN216_14665 [Streptomyces oceani]
MTAIDDRAIQLFEQLEVPEGYKAELLRGDIVMMAGSDWVHNKIVQSVADQIPPARWDRLQTQDIAIPGEASEPQPGLVVLDPAAFEGPGRLIPAPAVTLVLEVVSRNSVDRDYRLKRSIYAAGGVPAYLVIDPLSGRCVLFTEPAGVGAAADYRVERISKFEEPIPLESLDVTLETSSFRTQP